MDEDDCPRTARRKAARASDSLVLVGDLVTGCPRLVAHRGLHAEARGGPRENTVTAVLGAVRAGVRWIEVDVRVTADGAVVLLHDATLERLWGDSRSIAEMGIEEVLDVGRGDVRIPLLADALNALSGSGATLLIDMDDAALAVPSLGVVADSVADVAIAWCGDPTAMRRIRERDEKAAIWTAWYSAEPPTGSDLDGVSVLNTQHVLVGPELVRAAHDRGVDVAVWTVDDESRAVDMASIGVDSITTNDVPRIRGALSAAGFGAG